MQRRTFIKLSTVLSGLGTLMFSTIKAIPVNKFNKTREIKTKIPSSLKYTKEHIWIQINGSTAKIGVTDFLQSELGDIVYIELPTTDKTLVKDEVFASIEAVKTIHELHMPVSGEIIKTNPLLEDEPNMI
jgi:glycine cleavage system H protein